MIIYILLVIVPLLIWAAMGFQGLGKHSSVIARLLFVSLIFVGASAYAIAQVASL